MQENNKKQISALKTKALDMLSRREHSRHEIEKKLFSWVRQEAYRKNKNNLDSYEDNLQPIPSNFFDDVCSLLDDFEAKGWLSDQRYVESLINQKANRLGGARIKQELTVKGVDGTLIQSTLEELKSTEQQRANDVWSKKFKSLPNTAKEYNQQSRFLLYRGFSSDVIKKILIKKD